MKIKRFLSAAAAMCVSAGMLTALPARYTVSADEPVMEISDGKLNYDVFSDHVRVFGRRDGSLKEIVIPSEVNNLPVTEIRHYAFQGALNLEKVVFPDTMEYVWDYAFQGCTALKSVVMDDNLILLNTGAFQDCTSLTALSFPPSVQFIGGFAFAGCSNLKSMGLPNGWPLVIRQYAFYECNQLENITIPANVRYIEDGAFFCPGGKLKTVTFESPDTLLDFSNRVIANVRTIEPTADLPYGNGKMTGTIAGYGLPESTRGKWNDVSGIPVKVYAEEVGCKYQNLGAAYLVEAVKPDPNMGSATPPTRIGAGCSLRLMQNPRPGYEFVNWWDIDTNSEIEPDEYGNYYVIPNKKMEIFPYFRKKLNLVRQSSGTYEYNNGAYISLYCLTEDSNFNIDYTWYCKKEGAKRYSAISGDDYTVDTSGKFTFHGPERKGYGTEYNNALIYCIAKDSQTGASVKSATVTLKYVTTPLIITEDLEYFAFFDSADTKPSVTLPFRASGNTLTYQFYYTPKSSSDSTLIGSFSESDWTGSLTFAGTDNKGLTDAYDGGTIHCIVNDADKQQAASNTLTLKQKKKEIDRHINIKIPIAGQKYGAYYNDETSVVPEELLKYSPVWLVTYPMQHGVTDSTQVMTENDMFKAGYQYEFNLVLHTSSDMSKAVAQQIKTEGLIINGETVKDLNVGELGGTIIFCKWITPVIRGGKIKGELNKDGFITPADAHVLRDFLQGKNPDNLVDWEAADYDSSEHLNAKDLTLLKRENIYAVG